MRGAFRALNSACRHEKTPRQRMSWGARPYLQRNCYCSSGRAESRNFTHIDHAKGLPIMVDVGNKSPSVRIARAQSIVWLPDEVIKHFAGTDIQTKKGPVFATAIIAGTMAAKKTWDLIPFCHPLNIENCKIDIQFDGSNHLVIQSEVKVTHKTGVEMEALTACSVAALTVYDMCKALSHEIVIKETKLLHKSGGKSDYSSENK